jgi:hypothetical protein
MSTSKIIAAVIIGLLLSIFIVIKSQKRDKVKALEKETTENLTLLKQQLSTADSTKMLEAKTALLNEISKVFTQIDLLILLYYNENEIFVRNIQSDALFEAAIRKLELKLTNPIQQILQLHPIDFDSKVNINKSVHQIEDCLNPDSFEFHQYINSHSERKGHFWDLFSSVNIISEEIEGSLYSNLDKMDSIVYQLKQELLVRDK